jgi:hypothetical protein
MFCKGKLNTFNYLSLVTDHSQNYKLLLNTAAMVYYPSHAHSTVRKALIKHITIKTEID